MKADKKVTFKVNMPVDPDAKPVEYKEVSLDVKTPTLAQINGAQSAYNQKFGEVIKDKAPLRIEVSKLLEERGVWSKVKEDEYKTLTTELDSKVNQLKRGGMRLLDARDLALKIRNLRKKITSLNSERQVLDTNTAEAQAEQARFNYFVTECIFYTDTGKRVFEKLDDYLENSTEDYALECARQFGALQYGLDADFEKKFPENQFLLKFKFVNDKLQLINRDNKLINEKGELVNELGQLVDEDGKLLDNTGTSLTDDGAPDIEPLPFLDDDNSPIEGSELKEASA